VADLATLVVRLEAQTAQFQASLDKANRKLTSFERTTKKTISDLERNFQKLRKNAINFGAGLAASFGAGFIANKFIQNTKEAQDAMAQLQATLRSTGGAAGRSADQLVASASALQKVTTFGDDAIISMQSVLLTFQQIQGVNFDRATASILDLATKLGKDLNTAATQVGKALNDPVQGIAALSKVGITFTKEQKELIKSLVETGQAAQAQVIILDALDEKFGGSAKAARDTFGGALAALSNSFNDLFEVTDGGTKDLVKSLNTLTDTLSNPETIRAAQALGTALARIFSGAVQIAVGLINTLQDASDRLIKQLDAYLAFIESRYEKLPAIFSQTPLFDKAEAIAEIKELRKLLARQFQDGVTLQGERASRAQGPQNSRRNAVTPRVPAEQVAPESVNYETIERQFKNVEAAIKAGTAAIEIQRQGIRANIDELTTFLNTYGSLTDAQLASAGLTREQLEAATAAVGVLANELAATYIPALEEVEITAKKIGESLSPMAQMYKEMLAEIRSATETELEATERTIREFSLKVAELIRAGIISPEAGQDFIQRFVDQQEKPFSQLEEFGKQAARNIQTAFANFLFDPFSNGLRGMLAGFLDTIRRMVAEAAAAKILTMLFSWMGNQGGFLGSIGSSLLKGLETRASGGPVRSNSAYLVGEKGPELLVGAAGKIVPGTDLGGGGMLTVAPVYNIDARGATQDLIKQLPAILSEHAKQTVQLARAVINDDISRGAFGRA